MFGGAKVYNKLDEKLLTIRKLKSLKVDQKKQNNEMKALNSKCFAKCGQEDIHTLLTQYFILCNF